MLHAQYVATLLSSAQGHCAGTEGFKQVVPFNYHQAKHLHVAADPAG